MAPTPARAHGTVAPTARNFDWTATPRSPVSASLATMEYVTRRSGLELGPNAVEGLPDHLVRGPFDEAGADAGKRPGDVDIGLPVHRRSPVLAVRQAHRRRGVDS